MIQLNPNIVAAMVQVIDVASSKGAFTGGDISTVGEIRKQLVEGLQALQPPAEEIPEEANDGQ